MARDVELSRRNFFRMGCCTAASFGLTAALGRLNLIHAFASGPATDYRALVCIFLFGGNDSNNLIVPNDNAGYQNYAKLRVNLALAQNTLLPITAKTTQASGQSSYGLHPNLTGLQGLFAGGQLAVMANVGTLGQPLTRAQYLAGGTALPVNLFSHSDQQAQWQTAQFAGFSPTGWAGRTADKLQSLNAGAIFPPVTSVAGGAILCTGAQTTPYALTPGASPGLSGYNTSASSAARLVSFQQLLTLNSGLSLVQDTSSVMNQSPGPKQNFGGGPYKFARSSNAVPDNHNRRAIEASCTNHSSSLFAGIAAPDFLLLLGWLRYPQQPVADSTDAVFPARPRDDSVL